MANSTSILDALEANTAAPSAGRMRAIFSASYGPPSALGIEELPVPPLGPNDVLVRVQAAALHVGDVFAVRGKPFVMRLYTGLFKPRYGVPGFDVAGTIQEVGPRVSGLHAGDRVFGTCKGSCAELVVTSAETLAPMPAGSSFEQAAALPTSGLAALHALRDVAKLAPGQRLLINGASGGVGVFALQLAKHLGAHVTGVCSTRNLERLRALGADEVIDYSAQDFTRGPARYDVILDNVENRELADVRRVLSDRGTLICNSGTGARGLRMLIRLLKPVVLAPFVRQKLRRYLSMPNRADLEQLAQLSASGALRAVIDRTYTLQETPAALTYVESGHAYGKVIVRL
jgi:NADPH:quinone reductase-like Zn-dependent oxidoreductase